MNSPSYASRRVSISYVYTDVMRDGGFQVDRACFVIVCFIIFLIIVWTHGVISICRVFVGAGPAGPGPR